MAQMLKRLPAMRETWVRPLGREGPLEKEMATHSSTLAWKIPWTEDLVSCRILIRSGIELTPPTSGVWSLPVFCLVLDHQASSKL